MRIAAADNMGRPIVLHVDNHATHTRRAAPIEIDVIRSSHGGAVFLDENHAAALVLALQAAIAEVQARVVSL